MPQLPSIRARIEKAREATPASAGGAGLPSDLLRRVAPRLRFAALCFAGGYVATTLIGTMVWTMLAGHPLTFLPDHAIALFMVAIGLGVYALAGSRRLSPAALVDLGLAFEVAGSLGIGLGTTTQPYSGGTIVWGISWICVWILAYPLIVPSAPRKAIVAAMLSAAMGPLSMFFWIWTRGYPQPPVSILTMMFFPNFICAGMAFWVARSIHQMGTALEKARRMGSYELVELLSRGGMGEVWRARHRMLARPAAIKLVRSELLAFRDGESIAARRFEREAQATSRLTSPHTIELFDYGSTEDGAFYYVMELLEGLDLERMVLQHGALPPERAVHFLKQACLSLADAHEHGLVHRDIKPANLFVCRQGVENDFVKVLDFGLVKPQQDAGAAQARLTGDALMTGTPAYMAPECGMGLEVDARTDLYSLGCVAYWLLTAQVVFEGKSPVDIVLQHVRTPPVPPSARATTPIPPELERIVLWCLEKEAAKRPASATELRSALDGVGMPQAWTQERAAAWWRERAPAVHSGAGLEAVAGVVLPASP